MDQRFRLVFVLLVACGAMAVNRPAAAGAHVEAFWSLRNGSGVPDPDTVQANAGDTLTLVIRVVPDVGSHVSGISVSLAFDPDALQFVGAVGCPPDPPGYCGSGSDPNLRIYPGASFPFGVDNVAGLATGFAALDPFNLGPTLPFVLGHVEFEAIGTGDISLHLTAGDGGVDGFSGLPFTPTLGPPLNVVSCGDGEIDPPEECDGGPCCTALCTSADDGTACTDGVFCNGTDSCLAGACADHAGDPCPGADGDANCLESCDEGAGACTAADPDGSACSDGVACTTTDECTAGSCDAGFPDPSLCDDDDACTADACDEVAGCTHDPIAGCRPTAVDLVWTNTTGSGLTGSSWIGAGPGDVLTAEVRLHADPAGVSGYSVSLEFDPALDDELELVSATGFVPPGMVAVGGNPASTRESTTAEAGQVLAFSAGTVASGPANTTVAIGEVVFQVPEGWHDDFDVASGLFGAGDAVWDNAIESIGHRVLFGTAGVYRAGRHRFDATLTLDIDTLSPAPSATSTGVATINLGAGGSHLSALELPARVFDTVQTVAGPPVAPIVIADFENGPGDFFDANPTFPSGGVMPVRGQLRLCILTGCVQTFAVPLTLGGTRGIGIGGGTITVTGGTTIRLLGGPWTPGTASVMTDMGLVTRSGFAHGPASNTSLSSLVQGGGGVLQLVTPISVHSGALGTVPGFGVLEIRFLPEPGRLLLLGSGAALLALLGRARGRRD